MKERIIITRVSLPKMDKTRLVCALLNEKRVLEVIAEPENASFQIGDIYVGKVQRIASHMRAAFVEIAPNRTCFLPLEQIHYPIFVKKNGNGTLAQNDELVVQIERDAKGTKLPTITTNINLTGRYFVLTSGNHTTGVSAKIPSDEKKRLKELLQLYQEESTGVIIRTNAQYASDAELVKELKQLQEELNDLLSHAASRKCYSHLKQSERFYNKMIKSIDAGHLSEIVTDDENLYQELTMLEIAPVRLYEDMSYPLAALTGLKTAVEQVFQPRVWMKSGAFLVIEQTEALTVIDVNSGKKQGKKKVPDDSYHIQTNLEAVEEIAYQLRLRNLSGIIIVDFINLEEESSYVQLMKALKEAFRKDRILTEVIDRTSLGLIEITRKKTAKTLVEQLTL